MKKLLLLLCSIGANAAFADRVPVMCKYYTRNYDMESMVLGELSGKIIPKGLGYEDVMFMPFDGDYDKYLTECIMRRGSSQQVREIVGSHYGSKDPVYLTNYKYKTLPELLKKNPKLAAFAEVRAYPNLRVLEDDKMISSTGRTAKKGFNLLITSDSDKVSKRIHLEPRDIITARYKRFNLFEAMINENNKHMKLTPTEIDEVAFFLSGYLHDDGVYGLLTSLPCQYGLDCWGFGKDDDDGVEIRVARNGNGKILLTIAMKMAFSSPGYYNLRAVMTIPMILDTKNYKLYSDNGTNQKLTIKLPATGPSVRFFHEKDNRRTKKEAPVDDKTNSELLALMANRMTDLYITDPSTLDNKDKWIPVKDIQAEFTKK